MKGGKKPLESTIWMPRAEESRLRITNPKAQRYNPDRSPREMGVDSSKEITENMTVFETFAFPEHELRKGNICLLIKTAMSKTDYSD